MMVPSLPLADRLAAATAGRYEVEREIGAGGMAVVFAARDLRHKRRVAIKVLRPELAASLGAERFLREVETVAGLQHPHVLAVYDSGASDDGLLWYVMPFVEGESLAARIAREGALPVADAVRLAREVAGALGHAHARGLVHRDVKPENILLQDGHALLADFGIARAAGDAGARLTATGMAIGTPMYMSPEQALGGEVDARADVYALGCVLYEMLAGTGPFAGPSLQAILAQSITAPRPRIRRARREVPAAVEATLLAAMAKEPAERPADGAALAAMLDGSARPPRAGPALGDAITLPRVAAALAVVAALGGTWWWGARDGRRAAAAPVDAGAAAPAVARDAQVIAVLPFEARGGGALGGEGFVDLLSANLDGVGGIRVVEPRAVLRRWRARGAADSLATSDDDALAVARDLRATAVLTGTVVSAGAQARLTASLRAAGGAPLAQASVDGPADSLLTLVDSLSVRLLREVWRERGPLPELRVSAITTGSLPAMRAFLDGEQRYRRSDWAGARRAYERAVGEDSTFALAWLRLTNVQSWAEGIGQARTLGAREALERFARRLPARDRAFAATYLMFERGRVATLDSARALVQRYPDDVDAQMLLADALFHSRTAVATPGPEVVAAFDRVLALDSTLAPAAIHPMELALVEDDRAAFRRYHALYVAAVGADDPQARAFALADSAAWGAPAAAAPALAALAARTDGRRVLVAYASWAALARGEGIDRMVAALAAAQAQLPRGGDAWELVAGHRVQLLAALGRAREAAAVGTALLAARPGSGDGLTAVRLPVDAGVGGGALDSLLATWLARPDLSRARRLFHRAALPGWGVPGAAAAARAAADSMLALDSAQLDPVYRGPAHALRGRALVVAGDTAAGVREIADALDASNYLFADIASSASFTLGEVLSRDPARRADGVRRLRWGAPTVPVFRALRHLALARALGAAGDAAGAAAARATFDRLWAGADAEVAAAAR